MADLLTRIRRKVDGISGPGVINGNSSIVITPVSSSRVGGANRRETYPVMVLASPPPGSGIYRCGVGRWKEGLDPDEDYTMSLASEFTTDLQGYLENQAESGKASSHRIGTGTIIAAWMLDVPASDGKPRFVTNYQHAIRDIRYNSSTNTIQVTYNDGDSVPEEDWIDKIVATPCPDTP